MTYIYFRRKNIWLKMEKSGQWSEQKLKKTLWESLRKRNELSNRINVLLAEKEKKLKGI